jgi:hypothetical protein
LINDGRQAESSRVPSTRVESRVLKRLGIFSSHEKEVQFSIYRFFNGFLGIAVVNFHSKSH